MTEQFIIRVEARFEAAHNLREYKGAPEPLHGHSWKVEAKFKCKKLDHEDIGIDYVHVEKTIRQLASRFDHKYINEVPPFDQLNPTSENIAKWFFEELEQMIVIPARSKRESRSPTKDFGDDTSCQLSEVVVWEGPEAYVSYSKGI